MQKLKILHVVHDFLFGGIESYLYYLIQAQLQNPSLEVAILCCQAKDKVANRRMLDLDVKIYFQVLKPFDLRLSRYQNIHNIVKDYDIAQLHIFKPLLLRTLAQSGIPIIFTVHTAGAIRRKQSYYHKMKAGLQVWQMNNHCKGIVSNSTYSKQYWIDKGLQTTYNKVIYNGVHFVQTADSSLVFEHFPACKGKFIIGTSSRFISWKRVDLLIQSFAKISTDYPEAILLLVGDGPEREKLERLVEELNLTGRIYLTGYQKNVSAYQQAMDICVFPSVSEPFGLVAIECLHLGKPVLVMQDGGGLTELIEQIEPTFIAKDEDHLSELLRQHLNNSAVNDPSLQRKRRDYAENFNILKIEKQYYTFYQSLINHA